MNNMDYQELKNKSATELQALLAETGGDLQALRFQASERQLKNVRAIRSARKTVARVLTALKARQTLA